MDFNILLVDDDDIDKMAFSRALSRTSLSTQLETSSLAEEALVKISKNNYQCIFLDFQLPGTDGLSLLKEIRENNIKIPVVIITSQGDEALAVEMMKAGAFDYFTKNEISAEKLEKILTNASAFLRLLEKQEASERELKRITQNLEEAQRLAQIGSWEYDLNEKRGFWSEQTRKIFGLMPHDKIPELSQIHTLALADDQEIVKQAFDEVLTKMKPVEVEFKSRVFGLTKWLFMRIKPQMNWPGSIAKLLGTVHDISRQKQAEHDLLKAKQIAEEAAVGKSDFLSNMSHEIRTPMNAILGLAEVLLKENGLSEKVTENLKLIHYSADNLLVILNEILDYSKIEAGKISLEAIDFNLAHVVKRLVQTMNFKAESKHIDLKFEVDDKIPENLIGDPYRLNQILVNLAGNAIKFTSMGEVVITAQLQNKTEENATIRLAVKDSGIGIPQEKLNSIFDNFTQASENTARQYGGTGLGLPITKRLIELQGGEIKVESTVGQGSTFYFDLEFKIGQSSADKAEEKTTENEEQQLVGLTILVAEDNAVNQMLIKQIFSGWGITTDIASDGQEAVDKATSKLYDLILMDLQMPELSGYEATDKIRNYADADKKEVPIIALTADVLEETRKKVLQAGFNDFVSKPFKSDVLFNTIKKYTSVLN